MQRPSNFGFCFQGSENAYLDALSEAVRTFEPLRKVGALFNYVEMGLGFGQTMRAAADWLIQHDGLEFQLHGVEVPQFRVAGHFMENMSPYAKRLDLYLDGSENFAADFPIDFCFIDACHGKPCVMRDFLTIEKAVRPLGVVAFHDTSASCQGLHFQPHCGTGIDARAAVQELGLLEDKRPGWRKIGETEGDIGRGGHGCLFVQRV